MITLDPDTAKPSPEILRKVTRAHGGMAGVYAAVLVEGTVRPGRPRRAARLAPPAGHTDRQSADKAGRKAHGDGRGVRHQPAEGAARRRQARGRAAGLDAERARRPRCWRPRASTGCSSTWSTGRSGSNSAHAMITATNGSACAPIVRVPWNVHWLAKPVLDAGAMGIIFPMVRSAADAEAAVRAVRYPPAGERGFGPFYAPARFGLTMQTYADPADREILCILLIEHKDAIENIEAILDGAGGRRLPDRAVRPRDELRLPRRPRPRRGPGRRSRAPSRRSRRARSTSAAWRSPARSPTP